MIKRLGVYEAILNKETKEIVPCVVVQGDVANMNSITTLVLPLVDFESDLSNNVYYEVKTEKLGKKYAVMNELKTIDKDSFVSGDPIDKISDIGLLEKIRDYISTL